jgi:hypothetical protein
MPFDEEELDPHGECAAEIKRLRAALSAAAGYLTNAAIDLQTGAPKKTALNTIEGGLKIVRAAIAGENGETARSKSEESK